MLVLWNVYSKSREVLRPIMIGPRAVSGGTSVKFKVTPLDAGNATPAVLEAVRLGTMIAEPSQTWGTFLSNLQLADKAPVTERTEVIVAGTVPTFSQ